MEEVGDSVDKEIIFKGYPLIFPSPNIWNFLSTHLVEHGQNLAQYHEESNCSVTFEEVKRMSDKVCTLIEVCCIPQGTTILFKCTNSLLLAPLLLGTWKARLSAALINSTSKETEVKNILNITKSIMVVEDCPTRATIQGKCFTFFSSNVDKIFASRGKCEITGKTWMTRYLEGSVDNNNSIGQDLALVLCSSGSTGMPKGVALSHQNVIVSLFGSHTYAKKGEVSLSVLPQCHAFGLILMLMCLKEGAPLVTMNKFNISVYLQMASKHKARTLYLVPPLLQIISKNLADAKKHLGSVTSIWTGASSVQYNLQKIVHQALKGRATFYHSYGMTETTFTVFAGASREDKSGSCGTINDGFQCKIVDPITKMSLPAGKVGELHLKSDSVMMGYLQNPEATAEAFTKDGWLRTGDLGYFDSDHYFYVVERIKEMIKYNSYQVSPTEIEQVIATMPGVEDVVVVGVPDETTGEKPVALVVPNKEVPVTDGQIKAQVSTTLSSYKHLRGVIFVNELPKSPSGKPLRRHALAMVFPSSKPTPAKDIEDSRAVNLCSSSSESDSTPPSHAQKLVNICSDSDTESPDEFCSTLPTKKNLVTEL